MVTVKVRLVFAPNGQNNLRIGLAAHALHGIGNCHAAHGLVVDARDHVACLEAGFVGGAFDRRNNLDQTVFLADFDAHAHEFAAGFFLEFLEGFGRNTASADQAPTPCPRWRR